MFSVCQSKSRSKFSETNTLFQLFQTNVLLFFVIAVVTLIKQYFGSPIDCIYDGILEQHKSFVDSYCWKNYELEVHHSLSMQLFTRELEGKGNIAVYLFVFCVTSNHTLRKMFALFFHWIFYVSDLSKNNLRRKHPSYYEWLPLILLFQAILAYFPSWLWSALRDRRLHETVSSIKDPLKQHSRRKLVIINLANDLFTEVIQKRYAKPFFFCEFLNVLCFILNVCSLNLIFQNQFVAYGFKELGMRFKRSTDAVTMEKESVEMFPTLGRCSVIVAKKGNMIKKEDAICMISFNSLCESIFMLLWYKL